MLIFILKKRMTFIFYLMFFLSLNINAQSNLHIIEPGNKVEVIFQQEHGLSKIFQVSVKGYITIPEIGTINIAGLTLESLKKKLQHEFKKYFKDVSGLSVKIISTEIYVKVMGYVKKPGVHLIPADGNVQMAINKAGGMIPGAQLDQIKKIKDGISLTINYKLYLDSGNSSLLPHLKAMDLLFIPRSKLLGNIKKVEQMMHLSSKGDASSLSNSIKVFGEVHKPGAYQFDNKYNALDYVLKAGGVTRYAGVDQIRVINNNQPLPFNLKEFLNTGNKKFMPVISSGSTIFVPQRTEEVKSGSRFVYVMGQIQKPGAYELNKKPNFIEVLANAGGPNRYADTRKIRILKSNGSVSEFDLQVYTEGFNSRTLPKIVAGDAIFVPIKTDSNEKSWLDIAPNKAVKIIGAVIRPGRYEWSPEMNLFDILSHAGGPDKKADTANIKILKTIGKKNTIVQTFNLSKYINNGGSYQDIPIIKAGYTIMVPELPQSPHDNKSIWTRQSSKSSIYVFGQVNKPGRYKFSSNFNFLDIISAADGPTKDADLHDVHVIDRQGSYPKVEHINLSLYFDTGDPNLLPPVLPGDAIFIPEKNKNYTDVRSNHVVKVLGEVAKPGRYRFASNLTILDLLAAAGGPTSTALVDSILVVNINKGLKSNSTKFDLLRFSKTGDMGLLPLIREGDVIYIPNKNEDVRQKFSDLLRDLASLAALVTIAG